MKIIIIENELYLAQSIASKLSDYNFETEIFGSIREAMESSGDVYLLSTTLPGQNCLPLIDKFKDKNILLMVSYINNDTVGEPLKHGAQDYIVKPFMIEELVRKIEHYHHYKRIKEQNLFYKNYIDHLYSEIEQPIDIDMLELPSVIYTNYQRAADKVALMLNEFSKETVVYLPLSNGKWKKLLSSITDEKVVYLPQLEKLKKDERSELFSMLEGRRFLLSCTDASIVTPFESIEILTDSKLYDQNDILTIDEYVQYIVKTFQYRFPDTELSKKLGISRKSLWEKRKKYGLFKKK